MGRVGGEEFLCVLPRIDTVQCMLIARRFVKSVNSYDFVIKNKDTEKQSVSITVSIGIATTSADVDDARQLYDQADKALNQAKKNGTNCVMQYKSK